MLGFPRCGEPTSKPGLLPPLPAVILTPARAAMRPPPSSIRYLPLGLLAVLSSLMVCIALVTTYRSGYLIHNAFK